ncbi:MAG: hypothetical protein GXP49_13110 [Deltaproteobacteria bacterium]|nr:hypothetical protein [Deltaproteobacteria bacterium]
MVKGIDFFQTYFEKYADCYLVIGGAAASEWFAKQELTFRATKDIDIVLLIEAINDAFIKHFWDFVLEGGYEIKQRSDGRPIYYRFAKPQRNDFPEMLELFSRGPSGLSLGDKQTVVPIPKEDDASSLSAILMDVDYYRVVHDFREVIAGLPLITPAGIILLKAKAWLDLSARSRSGERIDGKHIKKHRNDVFRMAMLLPAGEVFTVPQNVYDDLHLFLEAFPEQSPEWKNIKAAVGKNPVLPPVREVIAALNDAFSPPK